MSSIVSELEAGLNAQLKSLADDIRATEEKLMRSKEGYLKVQGALEILTVIKERQDTSETEAVQAALSASGTD